jgi:hypothetical protein
MSGKRVYKPLPPAALIMEAKVQTEYKVVKPIPAEALTMATEEAKNKVVKIPAEAEAKATAATGGYKKNYTVKELKHIASRNNIKTTKKLDGKTVNLNKKGLMAKLKRKKLI